MSEDNPPYDLSKQDAKQLRASLENFRRHNKSKWVNVVLKELDRRGLAKQSDFAILDWNRDSIEKVLTSFRDVAKSVQGNKRTAYTEAGGLKFRQKDDPERLWIDSYSAFKTKRRNVVFGCQIKAPGDDPKFYLAVDGQIEEWLNADRLSEAHERFAKLAKDA